MKKNIVEVILYLLEIAATQSANVGADLSDQIIAKQRLEDAGFSRDIVASAFDWLKELIEQQSWYAATDINEFKANKTIRIFNLEEKARINLEVQSFILSLEYVGILDTKMREIVISQLMQLNQRVIELIDAKWVVLLVLMSKLNRNIHDIRDYFLATMALDV